MTIQYQEYMDVAVPGAIKGIGSDGITAKAYKNGNAGAREVWEITIPATVDSGAVYELKINGTFVGYQVPLTGNTTAQLQQGLFNAYQSNPVANTLFEISKSSTNKLVMSAANYGDSANVLVSGTTTNNLAVTKIQSASIPGGIEFGRLLAFDSATGGVRYANALSDRIVGVSLVVYDTERDAVGENGRNYFKHDDLVDALERCNVADGIWIETNDSTIVEGDPVYGAINNTGFVGKDTTGINLSAIASFQSKTQQVSDGKQIVLVRFNRP